VVVGTGAIDARASDHFGRLLLVTLEAARVDADLPVLRDLHAWLNSWRGICAVATS